MCINSINQIFPVNFSGLDKKSASLPFCDFNNDVFEKRTEGVSIVNSRIKENSKRQRVPFGVNKDIASLGKERIGQTVEKASRRNKLAAERTVLMAKTTEKIFDKKYGKNNYVVVSIGTSPAGIAKGLELMGHDVRYAPITNLENMYDYTFDECYKISEIFDPNKKYKNFLDSIGLNKNEIKKDKKHYVVIDYTDEGICLETVQKVAKNVLGIESSNVHYLSINDELENYADENGSESLQKEVKTYKNCYFQMSFMELFAGIPHLNCRNLDEIDNLLSQNKTIDDFNFEILLYHYLNGGRNDN